MNGKPPTKDSGIGRRDVIKASAAVMAVSAIGAGAHGQASNSEKTILCMLLSGEPAPTSVILQARFCLNAIPPGDTETRSIPMRGDVRFEFSSHSDFAQSRLTAWQSSQSTRDHIVKEYVENLMPNSVYFYRAHIRSEDGQIFQSDGAATCRTLPEASFEGDLSFCVFSCLSYESFYGIGQPFFMAPWKTPSEGAERARGYPSMDVMRRLKPAFAIATGDTVYYDHPYSDPDLHAHTIEQMRDKWHHQFSVPTVSDFLRTAPVYFMKDDHDFRYDDSDLSSDKLPSVADGQRVFYEQVPVPETSEHLFRTFIAGKHLQIWLLEGRDYRSPNSTEDTDNKTLWGSSQREWLERTLLESSATFKLIISPTPIVGPDDARKIDNHASLSGFGHERHSFENFLLDNKLTQSTFLVCGDRHWQYHSINPTGLEEFSCGTINKQNSRPGVAPGDPKGTDPEGLVRQAYLQPHPVGSFIEIQIDGSRPEPSLMLTFWNQHGQIQYAVRKEVPLVWKRPAKLG